MLEDVDVDLHIMDVNAIDIHKVHVILRGISPKHSLNLRVLNSSVLKQMWSTVLVLVIPLSDPPVIALSFNNSLSIDVEVLRVIDLDKVLSSISPIVNMRGCLKNTVNSQGNVVQVASPKRH